MEQLELCVNKMEILEDLFMQCSKYNLLLMKLHCLRRWKSSLSLESMAFYSDGKVLAMTFTKYLVC